MTAAEVIEQIKALPREERSTVEEFIRAAPASVPGEQAPVCFAALEDIEVIAARVFDRHDELFRKLAQ